MAKRVNKSSAHTDKGDRKKSLKLVGGAVLLLVVALTCVVVFFWLKSGSVDRKEFNTQYSEIQKEVSEGKYDSAAQKVAYLRVNGYAEDYRVLIVSADIENYLKNIDGAKTYADKVLGLYKQNPLLLNKDQLNRMEGYSSRILLPSPHDIKNYTVPKDQEQNADFQG